MNSNERDNRPNKMIKEGIYYEQKAMEVGTMGTTQTSKDMHDLHYWVKENSEGEIDLYYLKPDGTATAIVVETMAMANFETRFQDCSNHSCNFKVKTDQEKKEEKTEEKIRLGEKHLDKKEYNAATFEFGQALKVDQENLKANFGKGKAHIALGETEKAKEHFERMAQNEKLYSEDHKHLLNELGITLRRNNMFNEAIKNYQKALEIDTTDEALYYNMARAYKEWGNKPEALNNIRKAVELSPKFTEALDFLKSLE